MELLIFTLVCLIIIIVKFWWESQIPKFIEEVIPITEVEAFHKLNEAQTNQNNAHNWEVYTHSGDEDYRDAIEDYTKEDYKPLRSFSFHGHCHGCPAQKESYKYCLICNTYPPNRSFLWYNEDYDMAVVYPKYRDILKVPIKRN